jgi:transposase
LFAAAVDLCPSHFKIIEHVRPKMSCRNCKTITHASDIVSSLRGHGFAHRLNDAFLADAPG